MNARRFGSLFGAALVAGCGIPERDNPQDPLNRPQASLRVVDRGVSRIGADACEAYDPSERDGWVEVLSVNRGACIALDAADSEGPSGKSLSFAFELIEGEAPAIEIEVVGSAGLLSPAQLRQLPLDEPSTFEVRVRAGDAEDRETARVEVRNPPPTAVVGADRAIELRAAAPDVQVTLDGSASFDADGDGIASYTWSVPSELVESGCGDTATCTLQVPRTEPLTVPVRLSVSDGDATSDADQMLLEVRRFGPIAWLANPDNRIAELDPERRKYPLSRSVTFPSLPDGRRRIVLRDGASEDVTLGAWPDGDPLDIVDVPGDQSIGGESDLVWTLPPRPIRITAADTLEVLAPVAVDPAIVYEQYHLVDRGGALWGTIPVSNGGPSAQIFAVTTSAQLAAIDSLPGLFIAGVAARPGTTEVWSLQSRDAVVEGSDGPSVLVRHGIVAGAITSAVHPLGAPDVSSFAFSDAETIWALTQDGLRQLDVTALESGIGLDGATTRIVPSILAGRVYAAPAGGCIVVAGTMLSRVEADGLVATSIASSADPFAPTPSSGRMQADPAGNVWWVDNTDVFRVRSFDGLVRRSSIPVTTATSMDPDAGAMLVTGALPGVRRMAVDGTIERAWTELSIGAQVIPMPLAIPARDPDSEMGWMVGLSTTGGSDYTGQLYRVDFGGATEALSATAVGASYPVSGPTSVNNLYDMRSRGTDLWQWEIDFGAFESAVFRVDAQGNRTDDLTLVTTELVISASFAPDGSEGCAVAFNTSNQVRVYRVQPNAAIFLNQVAIPGFSGPILAAWAPGQCWAARSNGSDTLELYGFTGVGIAPITTTASYGNGVQDFVATGAGDLWVLGRISSSETEESVDRFTFDGSAWQRTPFVVFPENISR